MGRPSSFDQSVADVICERLSKGESLRTICKDEAMPGTVTVLKWLKDFPDFATQYTRAREAQADYLAEEILDIADDASNDWMERNAKGEVGYELNGEHVQRSRLRIDARKWYAGKLRPKVYGEKIQSEVTGADGGPVQLEDTEKKAARLAAILADAAQRKASSGT